MAREPTIIAMTDSEKLLEKRAKHRKRSRARYWANPEKERANAREWRRAHPEEHRVYMKAWHQIHKEKDCARQRAWYRANKERTKVYGVMRTYNVSLDDAGMLVSLRDGLGAWCDICRTTNGPFVIDHNHTTGKIRGLLCRRCNTAIGYLEESDLAAANLIKYLEVRFE